MSSSSSSSSSSNVSNQLDFFQSRKNLLYTAAGVSVSLFGLLYLYLQSKTDGLASDMSIIWKQIKLMKEVKSFGNNPNWNLAGHVIEQCKKHANKQALYYVDTNESYTFKEMDEISNQIANWVIEEGLRPGDVVGLIMDNRPEFIFTWLGLAKVGITCAFINHNLKAKPLIHSLTVCKAKHFIVGFEHADKGTYGMEQIGQNWYSYGGSVNGMKHLDSLLLSSPIKAPSSSHRKGHGPNSELIYIYTSGTTGNPKASIIKDLRYYSVAMAFVSTFDVNPNDRMYCSLPLYHSAGGMIGIGMMWFAGCTLVFRKKFSARNFWKDIREQNCTGFQYIGELCRYLLAQPETEYDNSNVRIAIGNGLRPDVWPEFQSRFNIQRIGEFYGATEGNAGLANYKGKVGAVGFTPRLVDPINPLKIVKFDVENEEIIRGENGFCIECGHDEAGELVGKIDQSDPLRAFHGYTDEKSTNNKILRDVFKKGDAYFRSGDLLKRDKTGYWYFVDRIGDTFRWKGENVSTGEVQLVVSEIPGVKEVNVYGVEVPHHDGRAGMASIVLDNDVFDWDNFYNTIIRELPNYARPLFIRVQPEIQITTTFKHKKFDLKKEGFDPDVITDELYFLDTEQNTYVPLTKELYNNICDSKITSKL